MKHERRRAPRIKANLPTRWEGAKMMQEGTVTSLSTSGCFVLTGGKVEPKELVRLEISIPEGDPLSVWGEVVDEAYEIGFAVRFNSVDDEEHKQLSQFIGGVLAHS